MILEAVSGQAKNDWGIFLANVQWLDIVFVMTFVLGVFLGLKRGLGKVIPKFLAVVLAQAVTIEYYDKLSKFLSNWVGPIPAWLVEAIVYAALAIGVMVLVKFSGELIALTATVEFKPIVNNVGGAIIGGLQYVLALSLFSSFLVLFPIPPLQETFKSHSLSGPYLTEASKKVNHLFTNWLPDFESGKPVPKTVTK